MKKPQKRPELCLKFRKTKINSLDLLSYQAKIPMDLKNIIDPKSIRGLSLAVFYYISGTVIGPLLLFGGIGYLLDSFFDTKPKLLIASVFVAFIVTNILLFRKVKSINNLVNKYVPKDDVGAKNMSKDVEFSVKESDLESLRLNNKEEK